ncbi:MAG: Spy/CpxP family protein refolding chaperone [Acidobacteriota bacterium]
MKLLSLLIPAFTAAVALAQPPVNELKTFLNLTDAQVASIQDANRSAMQATRDLADKLRTNRQNLRSLSSQANPDSAAVGRLVLEGQTYAKQIAEGRAKARQTALTLLSAEQKTTLTTLVAAMQLQGEIRAAQRLNLIAGAPEGPEGSGGPGMRGRMGGHMGGGHFGHHRGQ